ncbi:MAG: hypothetical protein H8M99_10030 [Gloeobacteraceae cyanobacterium ES-bin-144]|nr:hypothetical protein [Verrucomicrobiales bacterium]
MRKTLSFVLCVALTTSAAYPDKLSDSDRETLLETLERLIANADATVDARFRMALAAYMQAMTSDDAAMELYLKCVEKVNFTDADKKSADFREWKKNESERLSSEGFKLALRFQLRWLVLTLKASSDKADPKLIGAEAETTVDAMFAEATKFKTYAEVLNQSVIGTVFAKSYELGKIENSKFPKSPMELESIYEQIIMPPLRNPASVEALRTAWIKRITQEGIKTEMLALSAKNKGKEQDKGKAKEKEETEKALENFTTDTLPALRWKMELDLFANGDENGAAVRMLNHIQQYLTHHSAREWTEQFMGLLKPKPKVAPAPNPAPPAAPAP